MFSEQQQQQHQHQQQSEQQQQEDHHHQEEEEEAKEATAQSEPPSPNRGFFNASSFQSNSTKFKSLFSSTTSSLNSSFTKVSETLTDKTKTKAPYTHNTYNSIIASTSSSISKVSESISESSKVISETLNEKGPTILATTTSSIRDISHKTTSTISSIEKTTSQQTQQTMQSLTSILPTRRYAVPDRAVASQVLMYRQILHTECKPGLRLSRGYEGTEAQKRVKHMPWWEQGVETSKRMVISYNNLIVRLWLNGAIMPYVDGGYASQHINTTVPKDDDEDELKNAKKEYAEETSEENTEGNGNDKEKKNNDNEKNHHIDTLIDNNGMPPIPHPYWVDRLGFQQTDPVTDFRSGGVLSLAMLVHIVETCPNVHARFLPSGDTHMLPFGITCINVTDMLAKFCMFSKAVDKMDALLSQRPFWRMFGDPDSLLVLQELSMEVLCNVVVEMKRERRMPKAKDVGKNSVESGFGGQNDTDEVTVFDFAEILAKTEKRVNDDLLGSGPKSVDELRSIHSRNYTKYIKALEKKEQYAMKQYERALSKSRGNSDNNGVGGGSLLISAFATANDNNGESGDGLDSTTNNEDPSPSVPPKDAFLMFTNTAEEAKKATLSVTGNVIGTAGGVFNKFKGFGFRQSSTASDIGKQEDNVKDNNRDNGGTNTEEIDFAFPKSNDSQGDQIGITTNNESEPSNDIDSSAKVDLFDTSDAPAPPKFDDAAIDVSVDDIFDDFMGNIVTTTPSKDAACFTIGDDEEDDFL